MPSCIIIGHIIIIAIQYCNYIVTIKFLRHCGTSQIKGHHQKRMPYNFIIPVSIDYLSSVSSNHQDSSNNVSIKGLHIIILTSPMGFEVKKVNPISGQNNRESPCPSNPIYKRLPGTFRKLFSPIVREVEPHWNSLHKT